MPLSLMPGATTSVHRDYLVIYINGQRYEIRGSDTTLTLADFLRSRLGHRGTKIVCNEGDCGACSVLLARGDHEAETLQYRAIDSCIAFLFQLDCTHVVTVEGISRNGSLSPIQEAMVRCHGSQCGFCTPGFVTTLHGLLETDHLQDEAELRLGLSGNLCRCTGYVQIIAAALSVDSRSVARLAEMYPSEAMLADFKQHRADSLCINLGERRIFVPATIDSALELRSQHPQATLVCGSTDFGVLHNHGKLNPTDILCLTRVHALCKIEATEQKWVIGSMATWAAILEKLGPDFPEYAEVLRRFGSPQIREMGTLGGNLASGSPIADSVPFHLALDSVLELGSVRGTRLLPLREFYLGYRKTQLQSDELILHVHTPMLGPDEQLKLYKISKRRDMDISTLTLAIRMATVEARIVHANIFVGGVGPTVMRLERTESTLVNQPWNESTFRHAGQVANTEISPWTDVRGSADYRRALTENLLIKCFHEWSECLTL